MSRPVHADISNKEDIEIPVQKLDYMPAVDAKDYYGIIEIVYFSFLGIICIASILSSEKKMELDKDYRLHHYPVLNYILLNGYL